MSASEPIRRPFRVRVELDGRGDSLSHIRVSDGREQLVAEGDGSLRVELPPGLYPVRVERGGLVSEEVLRHSPEQPVDRVIEAPRRRSAMPTSDSVTGPAYYRDAARRLSTTDTGTGALTVTAAGGDPRLFIFVRAASREAANGTWVGNGLELCDRDGGILSLFGDEHAETDAGEGWLALSRRLPPGFYRLRWIDPSGSRAIALYLFERWDTQVFVPFARRPLVEQASILLVPRGQAFDPDSRDAQSTDMGLLGLRLGRDLVPPEVRRELLWGKFHNPMLGLIGAHLLLMAPRPDPGTVDIVLTNLRQNLLGDCPDVRALQWRAALRLNRPRPTAEPFDTPPLLHAGTRAVIDADAEVGGLIPLDGILSQIAPYQRADSAWTSWSPPVQTRAQPRPERTARPYLVPEQQEVVYLDTDEDRDMSRALAPERSAMLIRTNLLKRTIDALRTSPVWGNVAGHIASSNAAGPPVRWLLRYLDSLPLDTILTRSPSLPTAPPPPAPDDAGGIGPSLSVALPKDQAAGDDDATAWIDSLIGDAVAIARRTGRDIDAPSLARSANLPRAMIEERIAQMRNLTR